MKAIKFLAFGIITVAIQGCYTVIWTPDVAFPTKGQSENSESYYDEPYYGEYYPYYELPWWYSVSPPQRLIIPASERTAQETKVRNGGSPDRGTPERPNQPVIDIGRPTINQPSTSTPTTTDESSTKKSESTNPPREQGNTTNSRDTRNNDGSRSSDPPRR